MMYIYGKRAVWEALRSSHKVTNVYIAREMQKKEFQRFRELAEKNNLTMTIVSKSHLQKYCGPVVHQGIVAEIKPYKYTDQNALL